MRAAPGTNHDLAEPGPPLLVNAWLGIAVFILLFSSISYTLRAILLAVIGRADRIATVPLTYAILNVGSHSASSVTITSIDTIPTQLIFLISLLLTARILARLEKREPSSYGIGRVRLTDGIKGGAVGLILMAFLVGSLVVCHSVALGPCSTLSGGSMFGGTLWLIAFFLISFVEEFLIRGYILVTLARGLRDNVKFSRFRNDSFTFGIASICTSVIFAARHLGNPNITRLGVCSLFMFGLLCCFTFWRSGALWWAIGFHAAWDWSQAFLFGLPSSGIYSAPHWCAARIFNDRIISGGLFGPEGSLLTLPVLIVGYLLARLTLKDTR